MDAAEVEKLALLEDAHWWYAERRSLLRRLVKNLPAGTALDVGAAGGGNTRVLHEAGWSCHAVEYGAEGAQIARQRGLSVLRGDGRALPVAAETVDLVVAFDVLEHVSEDERMASEMRRVLKPGARALVAVPAGMDLWSAHDDAVGHVRRYDRHGLTDVLSRAGFQVEEVWSWNVLLRPVVKLRRAQSTGSDLTKLPALVNAGLRAVIATERVLPLGGLPGVSLVARARAA